jgi:hypothetical protein
MERIQALIDKLYQQRQQNCNPAQLLLTVQLLQSELLKLQHRNGSLGTAKVAVTLPANMNFTEEILEAAITALPEKETAPVPARTEAEIAHAAYIPKEPVPQPIAVREEIRKEEPVEIPVQKNINPSFAEAASRQQPPKKELHEVIVEKRESLNDRLKQEKTEIVHVLKDTPIKDLRKGIGINDRFTFVNELFRGDDAMYERSIKTINGFHILSEAEYWMNRELKVKLGWNDNKDVVQHFYQLVRRRFS